MTEVLRAHEVHVVRDGVPILQEVSLSVRAGEHWALLGANGAGKTTLLGLLGALTHPTHGTVEVLGRRLGTVDLRELRSYVGHVNPRHPLRSPLRVHDVVLTGLTNSVERPPRWEPTPEQERRADRLIRTLGLTGDEGAPAVWSAGAPVPGSPVQGPGHLFRWVQNSSNERTLSPLRSRVAMMASATESVTFQSPPWARALLNSAAVMKPSPSVSIRSNCLRASSMSATGPPLRSALQLY